MDGGTLRSVEISSPAITRLVREQRRVAATQVIMLTSWGLLLPLLLALPFEALLPAQAADAVGYLLAGCLVLGFVLWIPESFFRKCLEKARHRAFPEVESALATLRAGWELEWNAPYAATGREHLVSRGSWKQRYEWRVIYRGRTMVLTEIPPEQHEEDEEEARG